MLCLIRAFWNDEAGFIVSSELILVGTLCVIAMVVGLSQVSMSVNQELRDVAGAFGRVNQSYWSPRGEFDDGTSNDEPAEVTFTGSESEGGGDAS